LIQIQMPSKNLHHLFYHNNWRTKWYNGLSHINNFSWKLMHVDLWQFNN